jgi:hypothetical protein
MPDKRHILECDCVGTCGFLVIDVWDDPDLEIFAEFYSAGPWTHRLRTRAKAAWKLLRGKDHYLHALALNNAKLGALRDFLNDVLE